MYLDPAMASSIPPTVRHLQIKEFSPDFRKATAVVDIPSSLLLSALADSPDSVLVKISYTTVRASDRNDSNGRYGALNGFPFTAGYEAVGRVVKAGKDVTRFKAGDAVGMLLLWVHLPILNRTSHI